MHTEPELTAASTPQPGHYDIDPSRSSVTFRTRHLFGLAPVRGTFAIRGGTADIAEPITASRIHAEIEAGSFRTVNSQRDSSVRSARFLDAARYPAMIFTSDRIDADGQVLTGTLTVRDVTRPVDLTITECTADRRSFAARATVHIDRAEFGITAQRGLAGRYLTVTLEVQCVRH